MVTSRECSTPVSHSTPPLRLRSPTASTRSLRQSGPKTSTHRAPNELPSASPSCSTNSSVATRSTPKNYSTALLFDVEYDQLVVVKSIEFYSLCEHHLLPFYGYAHVGYLPDKKVVGLSKIPRIVDMFARRLQVQERMTQEIASFLDSLIDPKGVGVVVEGDAHVHGHARCSKTRPPHGNQRRHGLPPRQRRYARRVHGAPSQHLGVIFA